MANVIGVVLAAGESRRFGRAKLGEHLAGQSVLARSVGLMVRHDRVDQCLLVVRSKHDPAVRSLLRDAPQPACITGGESRAHSCLAALEHLQNSGAAAEDIVLIHDAARALASPELVSACIDALREARAAVPVLPLADTVVMLDAPDGRLAPGPSRSLLHTSQTPQAFRLGVILEAYRRAGADLDNTDEATLLMRTMPDEAIAAVAGEVTNCKLTQPEDLAVMCALIEQLENKDP